MLQPEPKAAGGATREAARLRRIMTVAAEPAEVVAAKAAQAVLEGIFLQDVPDRPEIVGMVDMGRGKEGLPRTSLGRREGRRPAPGRGEIRSWVGPPCPIFTARPDERFASRLAL